MVPSKLSKKQIRFVDTVSSGLVTEFAEKPACTAWHSGNHTRGREATVDSLITHTTFEDFSTAKLYLSEPKVPNY